jgi:hypothetical protein
MQHACVPKKTHISDLPHQVSGSSVSLKEVLNIRKMFIKSVLVPELLGVYPVPEPLYLYYQTVFQIQIRRIPDFLGSLILTVPFVIEKVELTEINAFKS